MYPVLIRYDSGGRVIEWHPTWGSACVRAARVCGEVAFVIAGHDTLTAVFQHKRDSRDLPYIHHHFIATPFNR